VDVEIRAIRPSSGRHGISEVRIRAAILACPQALHVDDPVSGDDGLVLFLGPDQYANPLEVVGRERADGTVTIFHAMAVRLRYLAAYEKVNWRR
jgi:hypothetical protein